MRSEEGMFTGAENMSIRGTWGRTSFLGIRDWFWARVSEEERRIDGVVIGERVREVTEVGRDEIEGITVGMGRDVEWREEMIEEALFTVELS